MTKATDRVGETFGKLIIKSVYRENKRTFAICDCSCGNNDFHTRIDGLVGGATISCGCYNKEKTSKLNKSHGMWGTPTYSSWDHMKNRCKHSRTNTYLNITYTSRWECFENFLYDMGARPDNCCLDRIDNSKGYYKENCRWVTQSVQCKNQFKRLKDEHPSSPYKGVRLDNRDGSIYMSVTKNYKTLNKGGWSSQEEAAAAFNFCTKILFGDDVELNTVTFELSPYKKCKLKELITKLYEEDEILC